MKHRRICILTQPLSVNYGGLLQAYALQTVIKRMGCEVWTEDRKRNCSRRNKFIAFIKSIIICFIGPALTCLTKVYYLTPRVVRKINQHTDYFKFKYIRTTVPVDSDNKRKLRKYKIDTYIVGSDQVWRPCNLFGSDILYNYFLDFTKGMDVRRIAYAASFGTSNWEFSDEQTKTCTSLIKQFEAISVREDDGVRLCDEHFHVKAEHVLDPTLLLDKEDYVTLAENESTPKFKDNMFCYFLDPTKEKKEMVKLISEDLNIRPFSIMPTESYNEVGPKHIDKCMYAPVTSFLRAYMDAEFIITDSFHGVAFSIIFNKPFIVVSNKERGISRMTSLLNVFNLKDRLIFSKSELTSELISKPIDFNRVNDIKKLKQSESMSFLRNALK